MRRKKQLRSEIKGILYIAALIFHCVSKGVVPLVHAEARGVHVVITRLLATVSVLRVQLRNKLIL